MDELPAESLVLGRAATSTAAAPTFMGPETGFMKDNFSTDVGMGGWFCGRDGLGDDSSALHLSCTLFLVLHQLHLGSSLDPGGWGPYSPGWELSFGSQTVALSPGSDSN